MKTVNKLIVFLERLISLIGNLIWLPAFISPPNNTPVDFITKDWYILGGSYQNGIYKYYPAKYENVYGWRWRGSVSLPKFQESATFSFNGTVLFSPKSEHVWEYVDGAGQKHHVTYNTYKQMKENPMSTTVSDKRKKIDKGTEKAREQRMKKISDIKGNSL